MEKEYEMIIKELEQMMVDAKKDMDLSLLKKELVKKHQHLNNFTLYLSEINFKSSFMILMTNFFAFINIEINPALPLVIFCGVTFTTILKEAMEIKQHYNTYEKITNAKTESKKKQEEIVFAAEYEIAKNNYKSLKKTLDCVKPNNLEKKRELLKNQFDKPNYEYCLKDNQKELEILCKKKVLNEYYKKQTNFKELVFLSILSSLSSAMVMLVGVVMSMPIIKAIITIGSTFVIAEAITLGVIIKVKKDEKKAIKSINQELGENSIFKNSKNNRIENEDLDEKKAEKIDEICDCRLNVINQIISSNSNYQSSNLEHTKSQLNPNAERYIDELLEEQLQKEEQKNQGIEQQKVKRLLNPNSSNH